MSALREWPKGAKGNFQAKKREVVFVSDHITVIDELNKGTPKLG